MKRTFTWIIVLLMLVGAMPKLQADEKKQCLVVWRVSGDDKQEKEEYFSFFVENNPVIKVQGDEVNISSDGTYKVKQNEYEDWEYAYSLTLQLRTINNFRFTIEEREYGGDIWSYEDAIEEVKTTDRKPSFSLQGNRLQVCGVKAGASVQVFSLGGEQLGSTTASNDGRATVTLPSTRGAVIVKADGITLKLQTR